MSAAPRSSARAWCIAVVAAAASCTQTPEVPGNVVVVVDTDLPRSIVDRLRVDLFDASGVWFRSREFGPFDGASAPHLPVSFRLRADGAAGDLGAQADTKILVRLRLFDTRRIREYHGERFVDAIPGSQDPKTSIDPGELPRLRPHEDPLDLTPASEPDPHSTIDRLVLVHLDPQTRGVVPVLLTGACAGTMAEFKVDPYDGKVDAASASTCIDTEWQRVGVTVAEPIPESDAPKTSREGTYAQAWAAEQRCDAHLDNLPGDDRACVDSQLFVFGSQYFVGDAYDAAPERIVRTSRFWIDRAPYTVQRFLDTHLAFDAAKATVLAYDPAQAPFCTLHAPSRDPYTPVDPNQRPLNCVSWETARLLCHAAGGDLPTEAQWEAVAGMAGSTDGTKRLFPWGNDFPRCDARQISFNENCPPVAGAGPIAAGHLDDPTLPSTIDRYTDPVTGNVTPAPYAVTGLGGSVMEWTRDYARPLGDQCWRTAPQLDPVCTQGQFVRSARGGGPYSTIFGVQWLSVTHRYANLEASVSTSGGSLFGFRCVYASRPSP